MRGGRHAGQQALEGCAGHGSANLPTGHLAEVLETTGRQCRRPPGLAPVEVRTAMTVINSMSWERGQSRLGRLNDAYSVCWQTPINRR